MQTHRLICHPDTPALGVRLVDVGLAWAGPSLLWLDYHVTHSDSLLTPATKQPARTDGLWKTTCFELFVRPQGGNSYVEFNFGPSSEWAAYAFDDYRTGMREFPSRNPEIQTTPSASHSWLAVRAMPTLPATPLQIALSAVIEETDGTKSYWALRHPPGPPDFHHPDCFALELAAPDLP